MFESCTKIVLLSVYIYTRFLNQCIRLSSQISSSHGIRALPSLIIIKKNRSDLAAMSNEEGKSKDGETATLRKTISPYDITSNDNPKSLLTQV